MILGDKDVSGRIAGGGIGGISQLEAGVHSGASFSGAVGMETVEGLLRSDWSGDGAKREGYAGNKQNEFLRHINKEFKLDQKN